MRLQGKTILILPDDPPERSEGGVLIPKTVKEKPNEGIVLDIGPGCELAHRGSRVQYPRKQANVMQIGGVEHHLIIEDQLFYVYD